MTHTSRQCAATWFCSLLHRVSGGSLVDSSAIASAEGDLLHSRPVRRHLVLFAAASALLVSCGGDDDDGGSADDGGEAAGDYCEALAAVKAASDEFAPTMESGDATPEQVEGALTSLQATFPDWEAAAPEEIAEDVRLVIDTTEGMVDALSAAGWNLANLELTTENEALIAALDSDEYNEAGDRIDAYGEQECGITIDEES